ncbi:hypothetical protein D1B31_18365 [Neobacillus notoginsengisoli]|uniref:Uncharacterized protein n=1 Tax=Neobacillus notoginsengisoli TaxID=1578198 RepID=A0A417YQ04_9BACI|nr:hypothetical protein [Neobacillus notoginsengisoli]RHW36048.1 hypothetical protein D1B31_18365 [Neobacillus notoginsengisoli]
MADKKDSATYCYKIFERKLDVETYHFLVVHSDELEKQKKKSLAAKVQKENEKLTGALTKLCEPAFHCEEGRP